MNTAEGAAASAGSAGSGGVAPAEGTTVDARAAVDTPVPDEETPDRGTNRESEVPWEAADPSASWANQPA